VAGVLVVGDMSSMLRPRFCYVVIGVDLVAGMTFSEGRYVSFIERGVFLMPRGLRPGRLPVMAGMPFVRGVPGMGTVILLGHDRLFRLCRVLVIIHGQHPTPPSILNTFPIARPYRL